MGCCPRHTRHVPYYTPAGSVLCAACGQTLSFVPPDPYSGPEPWPESMYETWFPEADARAAYRHYLYVWHRRRRKGD